MGYASVSDCQEAISSREFTEWQAYDRLEPIIPNWEMLFGTIAATIANTSRNVKKTPKPYTWRDLLPRWDNPDKRQTVDEQISVVEQLNAMFGGADLRGNKASTA